MKKKNSGQVLVIFIIMIPILISFIAIIGETGYLIYTKNKYSNITKEALTTSLTKESENKKEIIEAYIKANLTDYSSLDIEENEGRLRVTLIKNQNSIFTNLIKEFKYTIKIDYIGYKEEDKIIIKE